MARIIPLSLALHGAIAGQMPKDVDLSNLHMQMQELVAKAKHAANSSHNFDVFLADEDGHDYKSSGDVHDKVAKVVMGLDVGPTAAIEVGNATCHRGGDSHDPACLGVAVGVQAIASVGFSACLLAYNPPELFSGTVSWTDANPELSTPDITDFDWDLILTDTCEGKGCGDLSVLDKYAALLTDAAKEDSQIVRSNANTIQAEIDAHLMVDLNCMVVKAQELGRVGTRLARLDNLAEIQYNRTKNDFDDCRGSRFRFFWCGDEPKKKKRVVPQEFKSLAATIQSEFQDFEADVKFVADCSKDIIEDGCAATQLQENLNQLQARFRTIHKDWVLFKSALCDHRYGGPNGEQWDVCTQATPSILLAALRKVEQQHHAFQPETFRASSGLAPFGICAALMSAALVMYVVGKSKWKKRQMPDVLEPLLQA